MAPSAASRSAATGNAAAACSSVRSCPAEKAGLQAGDLVVEVAGKKVENIYDYTYALEGLKVAQPTTVVVQRTGQTLSLTVTPDSRN